MSVKLPIKRTLCLGKVAYTSKARRNEVGLELNINTEGMGGEKRDWFTLQPIDNAFRVSISGHIWNACRTDYATCGQITETIREQFKNNAKVQRICDLWDRWHLNDMKGGTYVQTAYLNGYKAGLQAANATDLQKLLAQAHYLTCCNLLEQAGLLVDRGYKYGCGWLIEPCPEEVVAELVELFS